MFFFIFLGKATPGLGKALGNTSPYEKAVEINIMISGIILFVKERLSAKDHFQLETAEPQKPSLKLKSYHNPSFQITSQFIWNHFC